MEELNSGMPSQIKICGGSNCKGDSLAFVNSINSQLGAQQSLARFQKQSGPSLG